MILILAQHHELNVNNVCQILDHYGARWTRLNGEDIPTRTRLQLDCTADRQDGAIVTDTGEVIPQSSIRAVWSRRHGTFEVNGALTAGQKSFVMRECGYTLLGFYALLGHAAWMNDYFQEQKSVNKLYQLAVAKACGLKVPPTLVTQDPDAARAFYAEHEGQVLCKAISQSGSVPADATRDGRQIYANVIDAEAAMEFDRVRSSPTCFQRYIDKDYELRVTVVGSAIFAAAIESQRSERAMIDWRRYDTKNTPYYPYKLPDDVERSILTMMRQLHLEYGAVDLIRTKSGDYVFLEVNPGGQWGWVEGMTGHPINEAVARWLMTRSGHA
ncbi:MAG: MvdC/MvdD family ATP grasp protein [Thermoanaerobaculia bacterium]